MASGDTSPVAGRILESLARYRFLCIPQMLAAGAARDEKTVRLRLADLERAELVGVQPFRLGRGGGTLHSLYWLTAKGAKRLAGDGELPPFPKNPDVSSVAQYWHRRLTVDALIAADRWAVTTEQELSEVGSYMRKRGAAVSAEIQADALLRVVGLDGVRRTYVLEVYRSTYSRGWPSNNFSKVERYLSLVGDILDTALGVGTAEPSARVLVVCDTPELRDRMLRTLPARRSAPDASADTWQGLLFKSADEVGDFGNGWHQVAGEPSPLPTGLR